LSAVSASSCASAAYMRAATLPSALSTASVCQSRGPSYRGRGAAPRYSAGGGDSGASAGGTEHAREREESELLAGRPRTGPCEAGSQGPRSAYLVVRGPAHRCSAPLQGAR
jgi:hypothetical protein